MQVPSVSIPTSILFCIQLNEAKLIHFMVRVWTPWYLTPECVFCSSFAVYSLKRKAREAYDWGKSNLLVFKACFSWHISALLTSVLDLYLFSVRVTTRSGYVISCNVIGPDRNQNIDLTAKGLSSTEMSQQRALWWYALHVSTPYSRAT